MKVSVGKWTKYKIMREVENLLPYLPETALFTEKAFWKLMNRYGVVVVKPSLGYHGMGVMCITNLGNRKFELHSKHLKVIIEGTREVINYLRAKHFSKGRYYIVQQKIQLAKIGQSPFDIRIMIQRKKESSEWQVTGKLVKVAARGYFITNAAKSILTLEEAIEKSSINSVVTLERISEELNEMSMLIANKLQQYYLNKRRIGLDVGIDDNGRIWIIEANLTPSVSMFDNLKDKSMFEEIKRYQG